MQTRERTDRVLQKLLMGQEKKAVTSSGLGKERDCTQSYTRFVWVHFTEQKLKQNDCIVTYAKCFVKTETRTELSNATANLQNTPQLKYQGLEGYSRDPGFDQNTVRESGKR